MIDEKSFNNLFNNVKQNLDCRKDVLLYAFNGTGKTRLSYIFEAFNEEDTEKTITLCYNAIVEDLFSWNNEEKIFLLSKHNPISQLINTEGLDGKIIDNFMNLIGSKLQPNIDMASNKENFIITFKLATGDERSKDFVKISKGEENLFKWSVFYTVVDYVIDILEEKEENRSINNFNGLKYIVIDDPISSIDDYKIYSLSVQIYQLLERVHKQNNISFLITTHHAMFFNIINNKLKNRDDDKKYIGFIENIEDELSLQELKKDYPIGYHLVVLHEIAKAIAKNTLTRVHYNMFRSVLEKFQIFLGYNNWQDMFKSCNQEAAFTKVINMNSHGKYIEIEIFDVTDEQKRIFKYGFDFFIDKFKIKL